MRIAGNAQARAFTLGKLAVLAGLLLGSTACVRVYQPIAGLPGPVVVDPSAANFEDVALTVHCVPDDLLNPQEAGMLCDRVALLFENQGAVVNTITSVGRYEDRFDAPASDEDPEAPAYDLILELRSRRVHEADHPLSWAACAFSLTLVPGQSETTFAQDVVVRDSSGFLLVSETIEGRIIRRFGALTFLGTDLTRGKRERGRQDGDYDLSVHLYSQLSQLVFNAKMHWQVQQLAAPKRPVVP